MWNPRTQILVVTLSLTGLRPDSVHLSHIRQGNCASMGPIVYPLNDVIADGHGNASTTTAIGEVAMGIPVSGWYIKVYQATSAQMVPHYCGHIANPSANTKHIQIIKVQLT